MKCDSPNFGRCAKCGGVTQGDALEGMCPKCVATAAFGERETNEPVAGRLGDYELLEEIARGGMGVVFKARQVKLNRTVALKMILNGQFASEEQVQRFRTEAESAGSLQHPNIVTIHEVGEFEGHHFFSMDHVEGRNLAELAREHALSPEKAAGYSKKIAEAIQFAHEKGILHRDLKPSNVLIDPFDQPRITDFGLAKRLQDDADLTLTGQILGTPGFVSPEQAAGKELSPASDVYSIGAILYYLLTTRPPFAATTREQTIHQLFTSEPVSPKLLNETIPHDLETICLKCLEKEAGRRYASARELAGELGRFLKHEPIEARSLGRSEKLWRRCRRNPAVASLVMSLSITLVALAIVISLMSQRPGFGHPAPMPVLSACGVAGVIDQKIYQTSPCDGYSGHRNHLHAYDPKANRWTRALAASPVPHGNCAAGVIDRKFYVVGGISDAGATGRADVYDPDSDDWKMITAMPTARAYAASVVLDGRLFVIGGQDTSNSFATVEIYDPVRDHWTTGMPLPYPRSSACAAEVDGRVFLVAGTGADGKEATGTLMSYRPGEAWTRLADMPVSITSPAVAALNGVLYLTGGNTRTGAVALVQAYDVATGKWTALTPMPEARLGVTVSAVAGKLYVVGGWANNPPLPRDEVFVYDPRRNEWWR